MLNPPKDFTPNNPENVIVQLDKSFENICSALTDAGVQDPKKLSLLEFYSRIEHLEQKHKERSKRENA
jgi:hypothetical protein